MTRRAGIYVRISDDYGRTELGVKRQEQDCRHLSHQLGWRVVEVYTDNDVSAFKGKRRPEYERMMNDVASGHITGILAWHNDRLHRSPRELEDFIDLVDVRGVDIHTVKGGKFDLSTPEGRLFARQLGSFARYESEHKSDRIRRKVEQLVADGKVTNGGVRPFGFDRHYAGDGPRRKILRDTVNDTEAAIVRECAHRVLEGEALYSVVKDLNARGIPTSTGRTWTQQALRLMLMSGRIAGLKEHHRQVVGKADWDPIISVDEHQQLRALLTSRSRNTGGGLRGVRRFPLTGLVVCTCRPDQPVKMKPSRRHDGRGHTYQCPAKGEGGCGGRSIKMSELEDHVFDLLMAVLERIEASPDDGVDDRRAALQRRLEGYERRRRELADEYAEGGSSAPEYRAAVAAINTKVEQVQEELAATVVRRRLDQSAAQLRERWDDPAFPLARKRAAVMAYIEQIRIHPATRPYSVFNPARIEIVWRRLGLS